MPSQRETARRVYVELHSKTYALDAAPEHHTKLERLVAHAQAIGAAKVLVVLGVEGAATALAIHHQAMTSIQEAITIDLAAVELAMAEKPLRGPASTFLETSYSSSFTAANAPSVAPEMPPVADHEAEGDGSADPTWCWCGRSFQDHLRRPR